MNANRLIAGAAAAVLLALCAPFGEAAFAQSAPEAEPRERALPQPVPKVPPGSNVPPASNVPPGSNVPPAPAVPLAVPPGAPAPANVALADLVARLAASTGKRFFIDGRARSRIYVSGSALDNPTYPLFLVALDANGLAASEIEGSVLIVPVDEARQLPSRIVQSDDQNIPDDEWVTRVVTVKGHLAPQLVPILRPLMPRAAHLAAFAGADGATESRLVIVDRYANVRRLTQLVEALTQ